MQCYTELVAPSAVSNAVALPFTAPGATNLVVAKTSLLQVFALKTITSHAKPSSLAPNGDTGTLEGPESIHRVEHMAKLILLGEYPVSGTITSLQRVKALNTKTGAEALLVSTQDAKISLIEWDPANHRISTLSIHYYERETTNTLPFGPSLADTPSYLSVDPSSRCAALKFGTKHLAIIPFRQSQDDLAEEDDLDTPPPTKAPATGADAQAETPYSASFVLPLTALDPALTHPVHLAFLHEYREPTFGIVSSNKAPSHGLLEERKDILNYTVFTLDLDQRASTTLLSVTGLPFDIFRVVPLPLPVGGALLVGANELVHVDQSGKTNAVAVNEFAKLSSNFAMADQSDLGLRLEDCVVEALDHTNGNMLIVLNTGRLAVLSFRIDGRSVSGLSVHLVDSAHGGHQLKTAANCAASLGRGRLFLGSEDGDSTLIGWSKKTAQTRKRSHAQMIAEDAELSLEEEDSDDDADDDLYADEAPVVKQAASQAADSSGPESYSFRVHDNLFSLGPIKNVCLGKYATELSESAIEPQLSLLASVGRERASKLAFINRELTPSPLRTIDVPHAQAVWTACAKQAAPRGVSKITDGAQDSEAQLATDMHYDQYLITCHADEDGVESSKVYKFDNETSDTKQGDESTTYTEVTGTEFEGEGETLDVGVLASGTRIVQVRKHEVRSYDADLGLSQIFPIIDEETDAELTVVHSSFCDPYLLLLREDSSLQILQVDKSGDLDELERGDAALASKWLSGNIYKSDKTGDKALAFLLNADGGLAVFELPNLDRPVYEAPSLSVLSPVVSNESAPRRNVGKETLAELIFADLGDETAKSPYLILRSSADDLIIYEPFHHPATPSTSPSPFTTNLRFRKVPGLHMPKFNDDSSLQKPAALKLLPNVGGYSAVFMAGGSPSFVVKDASSLPRVVSLRGEGVRRLSGLNSRKCEAGFAWVDTTGTLREGQIPTNTRFASNGWSVRRFSPFSEHIEVQKIAYHSERDVYVITTQEEVDFYPPEDDPRHPAADEEIALRPKALQFRVHLYDAKADRLIDTYDIPPYELVTSMEVMPLEVSEITHQHRLLVALGTISQRAENYAAKGCIYTLEIIDVVPEPGQPETGKKFRVFGREETKSGITALMGIAGLVGTAQGQKLMIRGLREDGSCLPVAFLDAQCYIASLKTLASSKLWIAADAWKGLWFGGFGEEPYKLSLFGKSRSQMEVVSAEFLPFEGQLYILIIDADLDIHVLQYDPEHPKSLSGQRLLHRSTFHLGHMPTSMTLLPSTLSPFTEQNPDEDMADDDNEPSKTSVLNHILITTQTGSIALLTPLDEATYRRLSALQTTLSSILEHSAGLNPRAYRAVESEGLGARGIVDGDLITRIYELGAGKRLEVLGRAGAEVWGIRSDLEIIAGEGLGYL
ncbi:protein CFT1 [Aureobasidium sp. EXF-12298]|nr:protein CFT1 [Aureobasidium sp. EXF-12298]KAI4761576.1 protein CFT1 [Aureobasidium sp. EXF-12344]KAI4778711.1 protein CFT1 [Aureobasidium sp. EXF-3400]